MISTTAADRYSDWVNPMVIKELRQGLAARTFHVAFLLIHVAMAIFLWFGLLDPDTLGALIVVIAFFLCIVQPAGAINAVGSERRAGSLDLVGLTDLSPWQIVWGKFCARSAITLLFLVSVLPYVVLRYFAGGLDIVADAQALFNIVFASLVLSAAMTGFSAFESKFLRGVIIAGMVLFLLSSGSSFLFMRTMSHMGGMPTPVSHSTLVELFSTFCIYLAPALFAVVMLLVGAVQLSPPSGRLEAFSRGLLWVMAVLGLAQMSLGFNSGENFVAIVWCFVANFIVTFQGFQRGLSPDAIRLSPLAGRSHPFRLLGRLLHAGWPFAFLHLVALSLALFGMILIADPRDGLGVLVWLMLAPVLILVPPLAISTLFTRMSFLLSLIIWFILGLVLWGTAAMLDASRSLDGFDELIASVSWCGLPVFSRSESGLFWTVQGAIAFLSCMVILRSLSREGFGSALKRFEALARQRRETSLPTRS